MDGIIVPMNGKASSTENIEQDLKEISNLRDFFTTSRGEDKEDFAHAMVSLSKVIPE